MARSWEAAVRSKGHRSIQICTTRTFLPLMSHPRLFHLPLTAKESLRPRQSPSLPDLGYSIIPLFRPPASIWAPGLGSAAPDPLLLRGSPLYADPTARGPWIQTSFPPSRLGVDRLFEVLRRGPPTTIVVPTSRSPQRGRVLSRSQDLQTSRTELQTGLSISVHGWPAVAQGRRPQRPHLPFPTPSGRVHRNCGTLWPLPRRRPQNLCRLLRFRGDPAPRISMTTDGR